MMPRPEGSATPPVILVAGGGLAGLSAAIRLKQRGYDPLVVEKGRYPREKLCGEFLGPDSFETLRHLGLWETIRRAAFGPVRKAVFQDVAGGHLVVNIGWIHPGYDHGLSISRHVLDAAVANEARNRGIEILENTRFLPRIRKQGRRFMVDVDHLETGKARTLMADVVLNAAGRHGGLFVEGGNHPPRLGKGIDHKRCGIQCHMKTSHPALFSPDELLMFFFPGGYGGIQYVDDDLLNVCMLAPVSAAPAARISFRRVLVATMMKNPAAAAILSHCSEAGPIHTTAALNITPDSNASGDLIAPGDAHVTMDPFTGSGMALAFQTGFLAGEVVADCLDAGMDDYAAMRRLYRQRYRALTRGRLFWLKCFRPLLDNPSIRCSVWPLVRPAAPVLARVFR